MISVSVAKLGARYVEARAVRTPRETAVEAEGTRLTYEELNARSNRLAHHLAELGAGPEHGVGLALPESPEMVVAMLAVLKTGAAYLLVGPGAAPEPEPLLILTDAEHDHDLPGRSPRLRLDAPGLTDALESYPPGDPERDEPDRDPSLEAWRAALADVEGPTLIAPGAGPPAPPEPLSRETAADVTGLALARSVTLESVLRAAWALLLARLTNRTDVVFGGVTPDDRTLPVRVRLAGAETIGELLGRVDDEWNQLADHLHVGLDEIAPDAPALFDTRLAVEHEPAESSETTRYPLTLVAMSRGRLKLRLSYRPDVFTQEQAETVLARLTGLLSEMAGDPSTLVGHIDVLTSREHRRLDLWNATFHDVPATTLPEAFEAQVARTPDATALIFEAEKVTYAELNERANRLARHLAGRGAGPESVVALTMPRSIDLIVAIYAVVKAGAAYLPIDPAGDVSGILADANPVCVLDSIPDVADLPGDNLDVRPAPAHPAYMIYRSAVGIVVPHEGIVNRLAWMQAEYGLRGVDQVIQKTPAWCDVSAWEIFWPHQTGATVVLARPEDPDEPEYLCALIRARGITTAHFVPSTLDAFAGHLPDCTPLRRVFCSGEELPPELAGRFRDALPEVPLHNLYGPAEASADVTYWPYRDSHTVPIGFPVWNTRLHVLDAHLRPVPVGVPGELYVAGAQLARGYLGRPALTASHFVAGPRGGRLFRTGDLVKWRPDGALEYVGGAPAEPRPLISLIEERVRLAPDAPALDDGAITLTYAELNAWANRMARRLVMHGVAPGNVVALVIPPSAQLIVAILAVWKAGAAYLPVDPDSPRHRIDYVLEDADPPLVIMSIDEFAGLPEEDLTDDERLAPLRVTHPAYVGYPSGATGRVVLGQEEVAATGAARPGTASSFDASVLEMVHSLTAGGTLEITPPETQADERHGSGGRFDAVKPAGPDAGPAAPTPIMQWLRGLGGPIESLSQSWVLRVPADLDGEALASAWQTVVDHHDALRSRLDRSGPEWTLEILPTVDARSQVHRIEVPGGAPEEYLAKVGETARERLRPGAPVMAQLVHLAAGRQTPGRLLIVLHRLVVDGVSWRVILSDLMTAVSGAELEPVPVSFRAWTRRLVKEAAHRAGELELWREICSGPDPVLGERRLDPGADTFGRRRSITVTLRPEITEPLLTRVPEAFRCAVEEVLLAAMAVAVPGWRGGETGVLVDVVRAGRAELFEGMDLSRTVGWFTCIAPVRLDGGGRRGVAAIDPVVEQLRAVPDGGIGYGLLRYLNPETARPLAESATAQLAFEYQGEMEVTDADWLPLPGTRPAGGQDDALPVPHALELQAVTFHRADGPVLEAIWSWPEELFAEERIRHLADAWFVALEEIAAEEDHR